LRTFTEGIVNYNDVYIRDFNENENATSVFYLTDRLNDDPLGGFTINTNVPLSNTTQRVEYIVFLEAYAKGGRVNYRQLNLTIDICMYEELTLTYGDYHYLDYTLDIILEGGVEVRHLIEREFSSNDSYCHPIEYKIFNDNDHLPRDASDLTSTEQDNAWLARNSDDYLELRMFPSDEGVYNLYIMGIAPGAW
jgi:hypothetical protein